MHCTYSLFEANFHSLFTLRTLRSSLSRHKNKNLSSLFLLCVKTESPVWCLLQWSILGATAWRGFSRLENAALGKKTMWGWWFLHVKSTLQNPLGNASPLKSCSMPPMVLAQVLWVSLSQGFKLQVQLSYGYIFITDIMEIVNMLGSRNSESLDVGHRQSLLVALRYCVNYVHWKKVLWKIVDMLQSQKL